MSVTVNFEDTKGILPEDFEQGKAYMLVEPDTAPAWGSGTVFISNWVPQPEEYIVAFSVCGNHIVWQNEDLRFKEVNLEISVKG